MNTEKQKNFIIHFLYYSLLILLCYIFFRYIMYMMMPFLIGFLIAFMLRPLIHKLSKYGHERSWSILVILLFYILLGILLSLLLIKGFFYVREWVMNLPILYTQYIEPNLHSSAISVSSAWENIDLPTAQIFSTIITSLQNSLSSFVGTLSKSILQGLGDMMASLPHLFLSFFIAILSSFFFTSDYTKISDFIVEHLSTRVKEIVYQLQTFIRSTLSSLALAYLKLMVLTFIELYIGFMLLGLEHALWIALGIAMFDILPVLGTGGIMIPWILVMYLNQQHKLALGLLILYLFITLIRNIIEPKIVGQQLGLHPLIMLFAMFIGAKLFGFLGIFIFPFLILTIINIKRLQT